ncbi:class I SAM-dependent methyltransferase [Rhizobium ruizarguesonis]|uniref:Class I SAM-dependent methyltransferase n=1 Tax=Rhizobium ruizarguesonis TaxID=2081791 RepID=A0ABY1XH98_9HYPH|nr:class I SAM-dependent methyltransferase [Rhizobium ruizarguesonis]MBY5802665.1 class I SAM-dependent methyltransferase [Rhizobium leguminosarum]NKJ74034.1 methyltransferase domain-containing protein [Rhizobium leguminosarum bv. viciae]QIO47082.1 class I SAM-dependent methyltransferase [Rhizobium leguminosarum bv. trifolii]QJS30473.1 class I SAM-dependent methyltransferase [Rhizobium leguminosarum bv. trifolii TA1]MBC2804545.1 class I SAM-dependent methyltransferase [Rhizobium ruizarguesonis
MDQRRGSSFSETDVVANYRYRPPYPDAVFRKLLAIAPRSEHLLDIGCGPGKISCALAGAFTSVTAVDPSEHMIALGRSLPGGNAGNIRWIESFAEDFPANGGPFDLTVAAASIHWMDHSRLFPHLLANAAPGHVMAVISGDDPFEPPWQSDWHSFLGKWVPEVTGQPFDHDKRSEGMRSYQSYLNLHGSEHFVSERPFEQNVEDFVSCQHSRDTFAPSKLGDRIARFDAELSELLRSYSNDDRLSFVVCTRIVWGEIKPI